MCYMTAEEEFPWHSAHWGWSYVSAQAQWKKMCDRIDVLTGQVGDLLHDRERLSSERDMLRRRVDNFRMMFGLEPGDGFVILRENKTKQSITDPPLERDGPTDVD